jgi:hypothetical protein
MLQPAAIPKSPANQGKASAVKSFSQKKTGKNAGLFWFYVNSA